MKQNGVIFSASGRSSFQECDIAPIEFRADIKFIKTTKQIPKNDLLELIRNCDFFAPSPRSYTLLSLDDIKDLPNLKAVFLPTTGVHWFNCIDYLKHGIKICYTPDFSTDSCAEFTFGLIHRMIRDVPSIDVDNTHFIHAPKPGVELAGKTIGVWGTGKIGSAVARIAQAYRMNVLAYDNLNTNCIYAEYTSLKNLLNKSDFLTIHLPITTANSKILDQSNLSKMKKGSYIINTARPGLISLPDLSNFLKVGHIAGAAIDIGYDNLESFNSITSLTNVILTPHISWYTRESIVRESKGWLANIDNYLRGERFPEIIENDL